MTPAHVSSFVLWFAVAASATVLIISNQPAKLEPAPHIGNVHSISFDQGKLMDFLHPMQSLQVEAKKTASRYELRGIVHSNAPNSSRAVIEDDAKQVRHYSIGSRLPNGEILEGIDKRSVTISKNGSTQRLELPPP